MNMHKFGGTQKLFSAFLLSLLLATQTFSQTSAKPTAAEELRQWRTSRAPTLMDDFGELARYRDANATLKPPASSENRVVFYGDSITDMWKLDESFPGKPYANRGISGQTTPQMLIRFRPDVINLQPKVVVILAGTNDIAGNTGPMSLEEIEANYASMVELARANKIRVVFSSVLPVHGYTPQSLQFFPLRSPQKILDLNRWLKDYCAATSCVYLDYFSAMTDEQGHMRKLLANDGLHPNDAGFKVMAPLAEAAIEKALSGSNP